jgi:hypothetical protein
MDENDEPLTDDPEILALLDFEPVVRKCKRHDGWTPANQRIYILGLAETGNPDQAAHRVRRTASGAWKVRTSDGADGFAAAWDKALALHHRRNPRPLPKGRPSRGEILAGSGRSWPARAAPPEPEAQDPLEEDELLDRILEKYRLKLRAERECRLSGRIVEADFYVRQLTFIEVAMDLACNAHELYEMLSDGDLNPFRTVATPMSLLLDKLRRDHWREKGEPDRQPLPELGRHDGDAALGELSYNTYDPAFSDNREWDRHRKALAAQRAEAQRLWEEKAARDAEAWRKRVEGEEGEAEPDPDAEEKSENPGSRATGSDNPEPEPRP